MGQVHQAGDFVQREGVDDDFVSEDSLVCHQLTNISIFCDGLKGAMGMHMIGCQGFDKLARDFSKPPYGVEKVAIDMFVLSGFPKKYFFDKPLKNVADTWKSSSAKTDFELYGRFSGFFRTPTPYVPKNPSRPPTLTADEQKKLD